MPDLSDPKATLNLPQTDFSMRAGLAQKEPAILRRWQERGLYEAIQARRDRAPRYVLHDGPPYANGHLHHGHILNKILKDIVVKDRTMAGYQCPYVPGWDCHGLPIEVQVEGRLGARKADMTAAEVRAACRAYADEFLAIQREEFRRLGVLGQWDAPYTTMAFSYEAETLRQLSAFAETGLLYKGLRPVNWCATHQTALAEAEVEYEDHTSPSVYVALEVTVRAPALGGLSGLHLLIWTTTPWTLPANRAVAVHRDHRYVAYPIGTTLCLVAKNLLPGVLAETDGQSFDPTRIVLEVTGEQLLGTAYRRPLLGDAEGPVLTAEHVTLETGTGLVHTAPGHGADDFELGRRHGLEVASPVDGGGVFTADAGPYQGKFVFAANQEIIADLVASGRLLSRPDLTVRHRYAHCWRCHRPILLRATEQWWVSMDKPFGGGGTLRQRALAALPDVTWVPGWGEDRIRGMLEGRPDWCLSRQRVWGVPIAVVYCDGCGEAKLDPALMRRVADRFARDGADVWFSASIDDLMGPLSCDRCGGDRFRKETDILDVWFDSGVSYQAVVGQGGFGHAEGPPIDLYLEGSDQHRGWFHSSLLCALATTGRPPYRTVLTHGFVVDGGGRKVSKSKGNFVDPFKAIAQNGAEILRLWVAAEDYRNDIRISPEIMKGLTDTYRKIRNTVRYLLGNLHDFDPASLATMPPMLELDRYAMAITARATARILEAYRSMRFHGVVQTLADLCSVQLSAFYLDVLKDRLYCEAADGPLRRSAQAALYLIARDILRLMAPVLAFTAEEAWGHLPKLAGDPDSVHLTDHPGDSDPEAVRRHRLHPEEAEALETRYRSVRALRDSVNLALEAARRDKVIGSSGEAHVTLGLHGATLALAEELGENTLASLFMTSAVTVAQGTGEVTVAVADGTKCPRCWLYRDISSGGVCARCQGALP